jgi:hypothetical protein
MQILARLLQVAGVDPMDPASYSPASIEDGETPTPAERVYSRRSLEERGLIEWVRDHQASVSRALPLTPGWDADPVGLVARALTRLGIDRQRRQRRLEDGSRVREYWLAAEALARLEKWSATPLDWMLRAGRERLRAWSIDHDPAERIRDAAQRLRDADPWGEPTTSQVVAVLVAQGIGSREEIMSALVPRSP